MGIKVLPTARKVVLKKETCDVLKDSEQLIYFGSNNNIQMERNDNTEMVSPLREKRHFGTIVSPDNDAEGSMKKRQSKYKFKEIEDVIPKNLMSNACEAYMISLRGNIDLFYFEQGQTEAFVNPVVELLLGKKSDMHNWEFHKKQLSDISKIIAVIPRRKRLEEDEPEWKYVASKLDPNAKYKKHYFVSFDSKKSTHEKKKEQLESVLKVRSS